MADSRLMSGLSHNPSIMRNSVSSRSLRRFLPSAKARTPRASQYEASAGMPFANVLRGGAVHDGVQPCLELPGALARGDDERAAAEARHAGLERGQRAQRGIEKHQAQYLAGQRLRLRFVLQRLREREKSSTSSRLKSARSRKRFMRESSRGRRTSDRHGLRSKYRPAANAAHADHRWCP
jgi:hypothetical protein